MTKIVLCFDRGQNDPHLRDATNARALSRLLDVDGDRLDWYHPGNAVGQARLTDQVHPWRRRAQSVDAARAAIAEAYRFLAKTYSPGDDVYLIGAGRGAYCARELTRLLGMIGLPTGRADEVFDYLLGAYALPRTARSGEDWERAGTLAAELAGAADVAVPVRYLGLFDMTRVPGAAATAGPLTNVTAGRHAVAIDGGARHESAGSPQIEEVWFRGAHCDVAGAPGACWPLADIALDWIIDGAVQAGLSVRDGGRHRLPAPAAVDPLAGSNHMVSLRRVPLDAAVHASVEVYLRSHPRYWRRLPARFTWADREWLARGERLMPAAAVARPAVPAAQPHLMSA